MHSNLATLDLDRLGSRGAKALVVYLILMATAFAGPEAFEVGPGQTDQLPGGKEADGIVGDLILRNDVVTAVVAGNLPLRRANMSTFYGANGVTPGCLFDLTLRRAMNDQITVFAPASQQGQVSWVKVVDAGGSGEARIETVLTAAANDGLYRRHEYVLRDHWQGVRITTTLHNQGRQPKTVTTDDRWTTFTQTGEWCGVRWADAVDPADKAGYAYALVEGADRVIPGKAIELKPGEQVQYTRFLAVASSPAEAVGLVAGLLGPTGTIAGRVVEASGAGVGSAKLSIGDGTAAGAAKCVAYPDSEGRFSFRAPPGQYTIEVADAGRSSARQRVEVRPFQNTELNVGLDPAAAVVFDIRDSGGRSLPCKVQFHGIEGTASPNLGPHNRARGCVDQYHSERGQFRVPLPPGSYRIVVTRGIEYGHLVQSIRLTAGATVQVSGTLDRLVDTTGWVSADYHNHSTPSGDNTCGTDDRIINLAAEHIEFAPTTEHNRFYDWRPHITRLGLADHLQTVPGIELTGSGPHLNSFPFRPEPFTQDNGAPVWHPDPRISAITLRDWQGAEPDRWIQINHPDMVHDFIDRDGDGRVDGGFSGLAELIDGLETQNYQGSQILSGTPVRLSRDGAGNTNVVYVREVIWLQMLNRGHRYAAMAVNDAHSVYGNGVGAWRMYMPSRSDRPADIDWRENSRHAKAGRSILTSGPFLEVATAEGAGPGSLVRGPGGVRLHVRVQCTDWIDIDRVQVLVNGRPRPELNFTRTSHPTWFGAGVVKFDRVLDITLTEDAHVIVVAQAEHSDLSLGYGTSAQAKIRPCAYHNPVFVDVDGAGFTPNGDSLGWPLPVKKLSVADVRALLAQAGL